MSTLLMDTAKEIWVNNNFDLAQNTGPIIEAIIVRGEVKVIDFPIAEDKDDYNKYQYIHGPNFRFLDKDNCISQVSLFDIWNNLITSIFLLTVEDWVDKEFFLTIHCYGRGVLKILFYEEQTGWTCSTSSRILFGKD